jgi:glyoxylase-like metal-dependent hydrolase (beta-lactamase superfamily II)
VLGNKNSQDLTLIDPGLMGKGSYKIRSIQAEGFKLEDIKRVIMTHTHVDHIGCLSEIQEKLPNIELWVHTEEAIPLETGDERAVYGIDAFRDFCRSQYGVKPGTFTFRVDRKLKGDEKLNIGGLTWEILHVPGHSPGSIALYDPAEKVLLPGDVVYADFAIGRFDLYGAGGATLKKSLLKLAELDVKILLPGHNQIVKELKPGYILNTAKQWEFYLT